MKDVITLLTSVYKDVKEQYKSIVSSIVSNDLYDFMYVSKTNNENIVVVLTNQLSDSELSKYTDSLKDTGFSLSYNANLDDNGKPTLVPTLRIDNDEDQKRFDEGKLRMERRLKGRQY